LLHNSREYFRALIQNSPDIITVVDAEGTILYQSPAMKSALGYEPEDRIGKNAVEEAGLLHPEDFPAKNEALEKALRNPNIPVTVEVRMRHRDGSWRYVEETITNLLADPNVNGVVLNARCITHRKKAEKELQESEQRFRSVVERTMDGVFMADLDTNTILESNAALQNMLGYTPEELTGMKLYDIVAEDRESIDQSMQRLKEEKSLSIGERRYRHKDGSLLDVEVSASVVPFKGGEASCCIIRDVTERKALEEQLRYLAFHDSLTDLPNRALFLDRLSQALAQTGREDGPVAVLLLDLNHFKAVNDSLGHDAGNVVLVGVAERMRASVRPGDTVGRIFGDEFAVLLEAPCSTEQARRVAERIQERLRKPFKAEGHEVLISPSIGIALGEFAQDSPEEVLRRADLAMYAAKKRGKAEYEVYSPSMEVPIANRLELERDLRRAVEREEFEAHYQPIVELQTGEVVGVEALARWRHPERGLVEAKKFVEIAEETGLIRPIGQRIVKEACRQAEEWSQRYLQGAPMLSVNLSANQFIQQPDLIPKVLDETGLEPSVLQVEITERALIDDAAFALAELEALKALGVSLAIDDFGTGYSGLYHLRHISIDFLKVDRAFVAGLGDDQGDEAIVSGTVGLAHALGVIAVAEGVETADQAEILKELGCDLAQGYYFAKPLPREAMEQLLADHPSY
jgi:diguanylate cyclase (GGDEF)-like protein/PAS domain S-box-containing protein